MRFRSRYALLAAAALSIGCQTNTTRPVGTALPPPQDLTYQLEQSGSATSPAGILLSWSDVQSSSLASYNVYSRGSTTGSYGLRGSTTSNTFHDNGVPHLQYFVTAVDVDGFESTGSNVVTVNEYLHIGAPSSLVGISLNGAIHLDWQDTPDFSRFKWYRVYSSDYSTGPTSCPAWVLEGTTVSHEFLAAQLPNGVTRCLAVSAVDTLGYESLWAPTWFDTPRPDARNVLVWAYGVNTPQSGFRFWNDANGNGRGDPGELGLVQDGNRTDIDFWVFVDATKPDSTLWLVPEFVGDSMRLYQNSPIADLTSIDLAPATGYGRAMIQAVPGYGYVFLRWDSGKLHYAGLRVTAVSHQYVIFDWSVQTATGNPELVPPMGATLAGTPVAGSR
jgi:hypothetical protein